MLTISPITTILLAFAITISAVEGSILYGVIPFLVCAFNELLRAWALRSDPEALDEG